MGGDQDIYSNFYLTKDLFTFGKLSSMSSKKLETKSIKEITITSEKLTSNNFNEVSQAYEKSKFKLYSIKIFLFLIF